LRIKSEQKTQHAEFIKAKKLVVVYHNIISSRDTFLAKLANISEGVNAMKTSCSKGTQNQRKKMVG